MRNLLIMLLFLLNVTDGIAQFSRASINGEAQTIYLADPTIFEFDGVFYLYGTNNNPKIKEQGFLVYTSKDLKLWEGPAGAKDGFALKEGDAFGTKGFWAPQVFQYKELFYMAYTANENIAIATAKSPLGPFLNSSGEALESAVKQIDPFIFIDDDGRKYLYHVRLDKGNRIFVAEMNDDFKSIKPETLREVIYGDEEWENTPNTDWPVTEGPTVFKREGLYYLLYSANDFRNPDYAVGYATSTKPLGPWKKAKYNPIIHKSLVDQPGPGHGDVFLFNNEMKYVLHTHFSEEAVHPRKTAIIDLFFDDNGQNPDCLKGDEDSFQYLSIKEN